MYNNNLGKPSNSLRIRPMLFSLNNDEYTFYIPRKLDDFRFNPNKDDLKIKTPIGSILLEMANLNIDKIKKVISYENVFYDFNKNEKRKKNYTDIRFLHYLFAEFSKFNSTELSMLLVLSQLHEYNFDVTKNEITSTIAEYTTSDINTFITNLVAYKNISIAYIDNVVNNNLNEGNMPYLIAYPHILNKKYELLYSVNYQMESEPLISVLQFDVIQSYYNKLKYKKCSCDTYFIVKGNNKKYCSSCGTVVAKKEYYDKVKEHPIKKAYRQYVDKANKRTKGTNKKILEPALFQDEALKLKNKFLLMYELNPSVQIEREFKQELDSILDKYTI